MTIYKTVLHFSLSWAKSVRSRPPSYFLNIHFNIIFPSTPMSPHWSLSFDMSTKILYIFRFTPISPTATYPPRLYHFNNIRWEAQITNSSVSPSQHKVQDKTTLQLMVSQFLLFRPTKYFPQPHVTSSQSPTKQHPTVLSVWNSIMSHVSLRTGDERSFISVYVERWD